MQKGRVGGVSVYEVSVIIPTRNESGNIEELVSRLECVLGDTAAELLFVDDSDDDTPQVDRQGEPPVRRRSSGVCTVSPLIARAVSAARSSPASEQRSAVSPW